MGSWSPTLSCGVFLPLQLLHAFLLLIAGCVPLPLLLPSLASFFIYSSCGKWVFPLLLWSFPPTATFTSFPAPGCWVCGPTPVFSSWLFVRDFPSPPLRLSGSPAFFATSLLCCYCLLFSFFSLGGGQSVQWAMLIWPRVVCGGTAYHLVHLVVHIFPSCLGTAIWQWPGGPPGFSI
jgi:hypothetical protein